MMRALQNGVIVTLLVVLSACTANPLKQAETFEQKAFALYGTYVIFQGKAASLKKDATVPDKVKQGLSEADRVAYPVAESLVDAALKIGEVRTALDQCPAQPVPDPACVPTNEQRMANALTNLSTVYFSAQPIILNLVAAVKGVK